MPKIIIAWWPLFVAGITLAVAAIVAVKYKIPWIQSRIKKLENISHTQEVSKTDLMDVVRKNELYKNGQAIYQHATGCKDMQTLCQTRICTKIEEVKTQVTGMNGTLKDMGKTVQESRNELSVVMTRVEDMMTMDRTKEMESFANIIIKQINKT